MKKNSTAKPHGSESPYRKRQEKLAGRIILATGVYDDAFRRLVQDALEQYKQGQPSDLPRLIKEADEIFRQHQEFTKALFARMNSGLQEEQAIKAKANKIEALVSGPPVTSAQISRDRSAFLKYAIRSLLFELSAESSIGIDSSGLAGTFYTIAASELKDSATETEQRYLRHIDVLLNDPDHKSVKAIMKYWDNGKMNAIDPFPAHNSDHSPSEKPDVRPSRKAKSLKPTTAEQANDPALITLREKLAKLELVPENEAIGFQLESGIYKLEREANDEWPDVIGGTNEHI